MLLVNLTKEDFVIADGERVAQMVISSHCQVSFVEADQIGDTLRGEGGFGSTGK